MSRSQDKGRILHHWDTDGICSSAILRRELERGGSELEWDLFTPRVGNYFLTPEELEGFKEGYSEVYLLDMAIPGEQVLEIGEHVDMVRHIDHHLQEPHGTGRVEHYNPVAKDGDPDMYAACTMVLREYYNRDMDLPTVLGVVGDLERRLYDNDEVLPLVRDYMRSRGLSFHDLMRMCELIDSNYKLDDMEGVREAADIVYIAGEDPGPILHNQDWMDKAEAVARLIKECLEQEPEEMDGKQILRIDTRSHVISTVGRKANQMISGPVVLVNTGLPDKDQIYARGAPMAEAIEFARGEGLRAGGKRDVVGIILDKGGVEDFLPRLLKRIPEPEGKD